jgi:hypothetical protein
MISDEAVGGPERVPGGVDRACMERDRGVVGDLSDIQRWRANLSATMAGRNPPFVKLHAGKNAVLM